ncbi:hypothetical protein [Mycolicibacterium psychrotolerans]|uniref:Uncharacterized protein n=1 Tax=Mycolicibacterium psychrotolerans TaxID=216929 RepID=A0A7I7M8D5_9MYCO|nr:hypothetical protein [Mycolicibacterium psychrotolerans]BBX68276.1 hypothetical protein MPSYJ_17370 [Mycolicibacterium psychrotolerans]
MKSSVVIIAAVVFGAFGVFTAIVACVQLMRQEVPSAIVAMGATVFCLGFVVPAFKTVPGRVMPRVQSDGRGTTFRPDRGIEIPIQVAMAGALVSSVLILVLLPLGRLAIPVPPNMRYALPFTSAFLVAGIAPMLWRNIRRGSMSYLRLTAHGFEMVQGWRPQGADWAFVKDVASEVPNQKAQTPSTIVFVLSDDTVLRFTASAYTPDGTALRDLVHYYWQHPESRDELTDDRAHARLLAALR